MHHRRNHQTLLPATVKQSYLRTLLQDLFLKPQEALLDLRVVQGKRQEVSERLLLAETLDQDLNAGDSRGDRRPLGAGDHCGSKGRHIMSECKALPQRERTDIWSTYFHSRRTK